MYLLICVPFKQLFQYFGQIDQSSDKWFVVFITEKTLSFVLFTINYKYEQPQVGSTTVVKDVVLTVRGGGGLGLLSLAVYGSHLG